MPEPEEAGVRSRWFGAGAVEDRIEKRTSEPLNAALTAANRETRSRCGRPKHLPKNANEQWHGGGKAASGGGKAGGAKAGGRGGKGGKSGRGVKCTKDSVWASQWIGLSAHV